MTPTATITGSKVKATITAQPTTKQENTTQSTTTEITVGIEEETKQKEMVNLAKQGIINTKAHSK